MKKKKSNFLELILGILAGIWGIIYSIRNLFSFVSGLAFLYGATISVMIIGMIMNLLFLILSILIIYHSTKLYRLQSIKNARSLVIISIILLGFSFFQSIYIILSLGYSSFFFIFFGIFWSGILGLIAGLVGLKNNLNDDKKDKKKFILIIKILFVLIFIVLLGYALFLIFKINNSGESINKNISSLDLQGKLVFQQNNIYNGKSQICILYLNNLKKINCIAEGKEPRWSPDGNKIAYWYWEEGHTRIAIFNTITNEVQLLDYLSGVENPVWSPDGNKIAYAKFNGIIGEGDDIYISDLEIGNQYSLTTLEMYNLTKGEYRDIDWSKQGDKILFTKDFQIYLIDIETKKIKKLETDLGVREKPRISPDGEKIVFSSKGIIYLINLDGSGLTQLTNGEEWSDSMPTWSPDSTKILFYGRHMTKETITKTRYNAGWFVINSDGTNQTLIFSPDKISYYYESPDWQ